ncbi:unnamed protein product, partial [Iphiclides podalirius]
MCLTDRFVLGIDSASVREKLFREDQLKLTRAVDLARAVESAQRIVSAALVAAPVAAPVAVAAQDVAFVARGHTTPKHVVTVKGGI